MDTIHIFDRETQLLRRCKALKRQEADHDFLHVEIADRLSERLEEINRQFMDPLQIGMLGGIIPCLKPHQTLVTADRVAVEDKVSHAIDEENLSIQTPRHDLIVSHMLLHWVNDLPGALIQMNRALKPDGLFVASLFGGETLKELRHVLMLAESEIMGGVSPRISPFVDIRDAGSLLQRAGFALPVTDVDTLTVTYDHALKLMQDLRAMGESNLIKERRKTFTPKAVLLRAAELYREHYADSDGRIPATFQIVYLTGWAPHENQQKPLRPGSAQNRLADALKTSESKF